MTAKTEYLGEQVYAESAGFALILYIDNGNGRRNEITMNPETYKTLVEFLESFPAYTPAAQLGK